METWVIVLAVFLLVGLMVTVIVLAVQVSRNPCPPAAERAPQFAGFKNQGAAAGAWTFGTQYRYAFYNPTLKTMGVWSPPSEVVQSSNGTAPIWYINHTPLFPVVWQRRVPSQSSRWLDTVLVPQARRPMNRNETKFVTAAALAPDAEWFVDQDNPAPRPPPVVIPPQPSMAALTDSQGCTWASQGSWSLPMRFCYRFTGAAPGLWGPWTTNVWASQQNFAKPKLTLPVFPGLTTEVTASWVTVLPESRNFSALVRRTRLSFSVCGSMLVERTTLDAVCHWITELMNNVGVLRFDLQNDLVTCGLGTARGAIVEVPPCGLFSLLGFTGPVILQEGQSVVASEKPVFSYAPQAVAESGVFIQETE